VGIDRPDGDDARLPAAHDRGPDVPNDRELRPPDAPSAAEPDRRAEYYAEYRAKVDAEYRAAAVDHGCDQVREVEHNLTTPEIQRIEAEDPSRQLVGFEFRLKGKDRLTENVTRQLDAQPDLTPNEAFANVKDAIRYTFQYSEERYTAGVYTDCQRLEAAGFEQVERRNSWTKEEYKGINSWWRVPESDHMFEVQFHTEASFEAKQLTYPAYERIRNQATPDDEVEGLRRFQRDVSAKVAIPSGADAIPDIRRRA
jgi:hypothetical protein